MSDASQGAGWWQASDDRWYPPEAHPDHRPPAPRPAPPARPVEPVTVRGQNGTVTFDGSFITIERKGLMARATVGKGSKRIPLRSITAVQWKPAGALTNGFIQFTIPGGVEVRSRSGSQSASARSDENSVTFLKNQQAGFEQLRELVERSLA